MSNASVDRLLTRLKSIRDIGMRSAVLIKQLVAAPAKDMAHTLEVLIGQSGRGTIETSLAIAALVDALEPPSGLPYDTRAALYNAASESQCAILAYILLEGTRTADQTGQAEDIPRPILPGGPAMLLGMRKSVARSRDRSQLAHLIHDPHPQVVEILLDNPSLNEADVLIMASKRPTTEELLRLIAHHSQWGKHRRIRLAIALNPHGPLSLACRMSLDLRDSDLRTITGSAGSPPLLRGHAQRILTARARQDLGSSEHRKRLS